MASQQSESHQEHHDVVCIGFGPAAISLGIALKEEEPATNIVFLEHSSKSAWRPLADLPGNVHMGFNFLNDLVTLENPRSNFTFIRYLHQRKLLVDFTNLGLMQPSRDLFEQYIQWCSKIFQKDVRYGSKILSVEPRYAKNKKIDSWNVFTVDRGNGSRNIYTAKRVVICMSQHPFMPAVLADSGLKSVVHSSNSAPRIIDLTQPTRRDVRIAIVGQTQQAAELFEQLYDVRAGRQVTWLVEDTTLRPETSVSLNGKDPLIAADTTNTPPELRVPTTVSKSGTNAIDPALINRIYETQYAQSIKQQDNTEWDFRVVFNRRIEGAETTSSGRVRLMHGDNTTLEKAVGEFDLVVAATGFTRVSPESLLSSLTSKRLLDGSSISVNGEYAVNLRRGVLDSGVGLWCIGSIGDTEHAVGDGSFRILAERSARLTNSLVTSMKKEGQEVGVGQMQAQL